MEPVLDSKGTKKTDIESGDKLGRTRPHHDNDISLGDAARKAHTLSLNFN